THDLDILTRTRERAPVVVAVPTLRDLGAGCTETEYESTTRQMVAGERCHRHRGGRARRQLTDRRAELDALGRRAPPRERRERVGAIGLRGPASVERQSTV